MKKLLPLAAVLLGTVLTGCAAGGGYYAVRYGPPPQPRYGMVGRAPGPGFVWADGYWDRRGGSWVWMDGHWLRPPHQRARWVPGYWVQTRGGYRFHRGYWR
jgi:hypothetical protein